jgi:CheY-like chemotaxis protein
LLLPRTREESFAESESGEEGVCGSSGKQLVLLVEDEPDVRRVVRMYLVELGYSVLECANGAEAATMLDAVPEIRILVSDLVMPGEIDGRSLAQKALAENPAMRVLLISGYAQTQNGETTFPLLRKPFGKADLARALERIES